MATGIVKWFNEASGYGFIVPDAGGKDLFVHRGNIDDLYRTPVAEGARVEFDQREGGMGPEAVNVGAAKTPGVA
jgi:cold shock protein